MSKKTSHKWRNPTTTFRRSTLAQAVQQTFRSCGTRLCVAGVGAVGLVGLSNPALAAFPAEINLADLNGTNGFVINGIDAFDFSGSSVSAAGDVNGDGFDDVVIGAPRAYRNGSSVVGESYVVFGGAAGFPAAFNLSDLDGTNGFAVNGIDAFDFSGYSVSGAGDVNGDGVDDVIIGAVNAAYGAGASYVLFGTTVGFPAALNLSDLDGSNGFALAGINRVDQSGVSISAAGDVNGDGIDDVIIGANLADPNGNSNAGASYVVFGKNTAFPAEINLSDLNGGNGFVINGIDASDYSGTSVSSAGDVNGDGIDDVIVGANGAAPNGNNYAGESYVVFGNKVGFPAALELSDLDGSNGFVINGIDTYDSSGFRVSGAGDVNGDGIGDAIVGAKGAAPNGNNYAGESYVVFGAKTGFPAAINLSDLDGSNGFIINGINPYDNSGFSISGAGDVNGDGIDDVIIGASNAVGASPNDQYGAGESYVLFGTKTGFPAEINLVDLDGSNGFVINGIDPFDLSGVVSAAGDVNSDGVDDIIIGANNANPNGIGGAGESYVVFGIKPPLVNDLVTFQPQPPFTTTSNTEGCQASFAGKFSFDAALTNISVDTLSKLQVDVNTLTGNNVLLTDAGVVKEGETFPVPQLDDYADGLLSPGEMVDVPFTVCLKTFKRFRLLVDVLGEVANDQ